MRCCRDPRNFVCAQKREAGMGIPIGGTKLERYPAREQGYCQVCKRDVAHYPETGAWEYRESHRQARIAGVWGLLGGYSSWGDYVESCGEDREIFEGMTDIAKQLPKRLEEEYKRRCRTCQDCGKPADGWVIGGKGICDRCLRNRRNLSRIHNHNTAVDDFLLEVGTENGGKAKRGCYPRQKSPVKASSFDSEVEKD